MRIPDSMPGPQRFRRGRAWLVSGALAALAGAASAGPYKFTDLGTLGGRFSDGFAINSAGRIVGTAEDTPLEGHAVVWKGKRAIDLNRRQPDSAAYPYALNDAGAAVGMRWVGGSEYRATLWRDGETIDLGSLGGLRSEARGISACGDIVGYAYDSTQSNRPVMWRDGAITDLGTLGGSRGFAQDVNSQGQIVGGTQIAGDEDVHATLWSGGRIIDLGTLRGGLGYSAAAAINDSGVVVGGSEWKNFSDHAVMWKDGAIVDLGTLRGHGESFALGVNNAGAVVGYSELARDDDLADVGHLVLPNDPSSPPERPREWRATLWQHGTLIDLNELLDHVSRVDWVLRVARAINDDGVITGMAEHRRVIASRHAFRLAPVSRPADGPRDRTCRGPG